MVRLEAIKFGRVSCCGLLSPQAKQI